MGTEVEPIAQEVPAGSDPTPAAAASPPVRKPWSPWRWLALGPVSLFALILIALVIPATIWFVARKSTASARTEEARARVEEAAARLPLSRGAGQPPNADAADSSNGAANGTWSPKLEPGAQPDLPHIYAEAQELREHGRYEEALQRHLWLHQHGLESDPAYSGVRLSFWLSDWLELARRYPKAKQALIEIRDRDTSTLAAGRGYFGL